MLNEIIQGYNSLKIKITTKLGNGEEGIANELEFLDDGLIIERINYLKKISNFIDEDMKDATNEKLSFLLSKKEKINFEIVLLASNSMKNIDFCLSVLDDKNEFKECLYALKYWINGDKQKSRMLFYNYFSKTKYLLEHYLISKVYGELLYYAGDYHNSAIFLRKAIEKRPENIEIHTKLLNIYRKLGDEVMEKQEKEILEILGGI